MGKKKISRNDPCPCGSGLKFKRCHGGGKHPSIEDIQQSSLLGQLQKKMRRNDYGAVRPMISSDFEGHKVVAVGNRIHFSKKWKTFHDFLFCYLKITLDREWFAVELRKDAENRHSIASWYISLCEFQHEHSTEKQEFYSAICTGTVAAYLSLAYDLYVLRHHSLLQERLVERLKNKEQFQGARYEVYVTATFIKAGFDIEFEDEADTSTSHCEFVATHKMSGNRYSVEAKSRHRPGLLAHTDNRGARQQIPLRIRRLLRSALAKRARHVRIVFIDVNMPPEDVGPFAKSWFKPLVHEIQRVEKGQINGQPVPAAYLAFTNHPYHYAGDEHPDPRKDYLLTAINIPEFKKKPTGALTAIDHAILELWDSINKYTKIPQDFENGT